MTSSPVPQPDRPPAPLTPPSKMAVAGWVIGTFAVIGGLLAVLWLLIGNSPQAPAQLELVRIGATTLLGAGGAFGLYLAWRRQRSTEIALQQKERDQADVARAYDLQREDSIARRITDLYTKAADQLGSDKAPVRLAGLYALERLAQDHPDQRQAIVNVLCAYLRMPYTLPGEPPPDDADDKLIDTHRERAQEREVRLTAQRILRDHLKLDGIPASRLEKFWHDIDLDLTGATLISLDLRGCYANNARFNSATFIGMTRFDKAHFRGFSGFSDAKFTGHARFTGTTFADSAWIGTQFGVSVLFDYARFKDLAMFMNTQFPTDRQSGIGEPPPWTSFKGARFAGTPPEEVKPFLVDEASDGEGSAQGLDDGFAAEADGAAEGGWVPG